MLSGITHGARHKALRGNDLRQIEKALCSAGCAIV
jgi:hypothetical protein